MSPSHAPSDLLFDTVAIVGVGLIGGSLASAIKGRGVAKTVVGVGRNQGRLDEARAKKLIDEGTTDLASAAARADFLVFCTPVDRIVEGVQDAAKTCRSGTLITDAGSVKGSICRGLADGLPAGVEFVGSHPLAGSEQRGFENVVPGLFEGRVCVVTPTAESSKKAVAKIWDFWQGLGMRVREMPPEAHDRILAETSHLPHLAAAALAATLMPEDHPFAAGGFRDTTRIASGDPEVWTAILLDNAKEVLNRLAHYDESLKAFRRAIESQDAAEIQRLLTRAKACRDALVNGTS